MIDYRDDATLDVATARDLYAACSPSEHANLTITAWDGDLLVGISRSLTDYGWTTYLADLAVRETHQRHGIGKELIRRTQAAAPQAKIVLLAAPAAVNYYPRIGMRHHASAWMLDGDEPLR